MFCFNCGCKLPDDSMFCFKCGAKIDRDIKVEPASRAENEVVETDVNSIKEEIIIEETSKGDEKERESEYLKSMLSEIEALGTSKEIWEFLKDKPISEELKEQLEKQKENERMYGNNKSSTVSKIKKQIADPTSIIEYGTCRRCGINIINGREYCSSCEAKIREENKAVWHYMNGNDRKGPVSEAEIKELARSGIINRSTLVWKEGFANWTHIGDTSLCYLYNGTIPPTPLSEISDVWVWSLATIPIFFSIVLGKYDFPYLALAIIMIVLNCLFFSLDIKALRKSGYSPESWLWLGLVLVPVYLFVRAGKTNRHYAPGIVWCVLAFLDFFI